MAVFIIQHETKESIKEALEHVKRLSPNVKPKYGMVDFSHEEINALEETFEGKCHNLELNKRIIIIKL